MIGGLTAFPSLIGNRYRGGGVAALPPKTLSERRCDLLQYLPDVFNAH